MPVGVHLQLSAINYAPNFFSALEVHVHPVYPVAMLMAVSFVCDCSIAGKSTSSDS